MTWKDVIFPQRKIKELEQQVETLQKKLDKRQEDINKTNAYWKRKMAEISRKNSPSTRKL